MCSNEEERWWLLLNINSETYWPGKKRSSGESFKGGPQCKGENQRGGPVPVASDLRRWLACWKKRASASVMVGVWSVETANLLDGFIQDGVNLNLPADCDCRKMEGEGKRQSALEAIRKLNASAAATWLLGYLATCASHFSTSDIYINICYYLLLHQTTKVANHQTKNGKVFHPGVSPFSVCPPFWLLLVWVM